MLLAGELPLRYYSGNVALRKPSWSLPDVGGVQALLSAGGSGVVLVVFLVARDRVDSGGCWTRGAGGTWKRMRLTKKTASSLVRRHGVSHVLHGRRWKRLRSLGEVLGSGAGSDKKEGAFVTARARFLSSGGGWVVDLALSHCPVSPDPCLISG